MIVASSESTEIVAVLPLDVLSIAILDRSIPITMPLSNCVAFSSLFSVTVNSNSLSSVTSTVIVSKLLVTSAPSYLT